MSISVDTLTSGYLATNIIASVIMVFLTFGLLVPVKRIMKRVDNWLEKLNEFFEKVLEKQNAPRDARVHALEEEFNVFKAVMDKSRTALENDFKAFTAAMDDAQNAIQKDFEAFEADTNEALRALELDAAARKKELEEIQLTVSETATEAPKAILSFQALSGRKEKMD